MIERRCVVLGKLFDRNNLIKITCVKKQKYFAGNNSKNNCEYNCKYEYNLVIDWKYNISGRSFYVFKSKQCVRELLENKKKLNRRVKLKEFPDKNEKIERVLIEILNLL